MEEKFNPKGVCQLIMLICDDMERQVFVAGIEDLQQAYETSKIRVIENHPDLRKEIKTALEKLEEIIDFTKCVK